MAANPGNPWDLTQFDIGFRPNVVKLDTAAITAAENYLEQLQDSLLSPHEEAISQSESHPDLLASAIHAQHNDTIGQAESDVAKHTSDWNTALTRDVGELQLAEDWLRQLQPGTIPAIYHLVGGAPAWMNPVDGLLPDVSESGSINDASITNNTSTVEYDSNGNAILAPPALPMQPGGLPAINPLAMPQLPTLGAPGFLATGYPGSSGPPIAGGIPAGSGVLPGSPAAGMAPGVPGSPADGLAPAGGVDGLPSGPAGSGGLSGVGSVGVGTGDAVATVPFGERPARGAIEPVQGGAQQAGSAPIVVSAPGGVLRIICECASSPCNCNSQSTAPAKSKVRQVAEQLLANPVTKEEDTVGGDEYSGQEVASNPPAQLSPPQSPAANGGLPPNAAGENNNQPEEVDLGKLLEAQPKDGGLTVAPKLEPEHEGAYLATVEGRLTEPVPQEVHWIYSPEWTHRFLAGKEYLIHLGDSLLNAGGNDTSYQHVTRKIAALMLQSVNNRKDLADALNDETTKYGAELLSAKMLRQWIDASHQGWCDKKDHLAQLYAADSFLRMMEEWSIHVSLADNYGDTVNFDLGLEAGGSGSVKGPERPGSGQSLGTGGSKTGAGVGHHRHKGWEWRIATSIRYAIVPLRKICELAIRHDEQVEPIGAETALQLYMRGFVEEKWAETIVRAHGHDWGNYRAQIHIEQERLLPEQVIEYARRTDKDRKWIDEQLKQIGWYDTDQRDRLNYLYDEVPTLSDHLHWLQRNVFDKDYVNEFRLLDGFEEKFWPEFKDDLNALGTTKRTAAYHYAAHWIVPPQEQLARLMQRLRPGRVAGNVTVSKDQYMKALAEQDVAPFWRERFYEAAFKPLQLRFLRQLWFDSKIEYTELVEALQDIGYSEDNALRIAASERDRKERTRATNGRGYTPAQMRKLYVAGLLTRDEILPHMFSQGYTEAETDQLIEMAKMDQTIKIRQTKIQAIMTAYRNMSIDIITLQSQLAKLHLPNEQVLAMVELAEARGQKRPEKTQISQFTALMQEQVKADADKVRAANLLIAHLHNEMITAKKESHKKRYKALIDQLRGMLPLTEEMPSSTPARIQDQPVMPPK